jgi:hypothetical protein
MNRALYQFTTFALCALLAACGGGGGGSGSGSSVNGSDSDAVATKSSFTLSVTDAPIDGAAAVEMQFIEVRLRRSDGTWVNFPFDNPKTIDLLKLQGMLTSDLLADIPLGIGRYDEVRLLVVDDGPQGLANHVELLDGTFAPLDIPGGNIKIKGDFIIFKTQPTTLVVDFDLRQSVKRKGKSGKFDFKPKMRLADMANSGHLLGVVAPELLSSTQTCSDNDVDTFNAVYVYEGHDVIPDDIDQSSNTDASPIATTAIKYDHKKLIYKYVAAFLPEGDYTTAITCNSNLDDLDSGNDDLMFFAIRNVSV